MKRQQSSWSISFRPVPVQGPGFGFRSGYRVVRVNFFFKSKRCHFSKKKKEKLTGCNRVFNKVLPGQLGHRVTPGFSFPYFFFQLSPVPALGWLGPESTRRASPGFKTMPWRLKKGYKWIRGIMVIQQNLININ